MDIDPYIEDDDLADLRKTIADLIKRKYEAVEGSPQHRFIVRRLANLRFSREEAGGIMEDLDPGRKQTHARDAAGEVTCPQGKPPANLISHTTDHPREATHRSISTPALVKPATTGQISRELSPAISGAPLISK